MWKRIPSWIRNKYLLVLILVLVWLMFFDTHNFMQQWRIRSQLRELRIERDFYREEIMRDSTAIEELKSDPDALERFAREKYLMKKEGEDVYILIED